MSIVFKPFLEEKVYSYICLEPTAIYKLGDKGKLVQFHFAFVCARFHDICEMSNLHQLVSEMYLLLTMSLILALDTS